MDLTAFDLKGKVALVTGGAHGIGFSIAEGMAKCGATVCFNCSNEGSLEKGLAAYKAAGIDAHGYVADVTDEAAVNAMIAQIKAEVGPVDILVNNAGLMKRVPMIEMSHTDFLRVIDVHVGGAFNCSKAVLPDMIAKREGKIINICSMMSELGRETVSAYAAAKGALKMLTRNIASEYGEYNIQCNGMGPGYIATAQTAPLREIQPDGSRHPFDTFICAKTPAGRWGTPEDMVGPCVFLASHASDFVNGQILYADGGILAYIGEVVDGCSLLLEYLTLCTEDGIISAKKAGIWTKKITDVKYPAMKWLKSERGRAESLRQEAEKKRLEMLAKALQVVFAKQEQKTA